MRTDTFKQIESVLRDYPDYDRHIAERERTLLNPDSIYSDENIGGGRSSFISNPTEMRALTLAEDRQLQVLRFQSRKVEKVINESDPFTNEIIREYYFTRPLLKTWEGVAHAVNMSSGHCRRLRNSFFERLANELGLPIHDFKKR